MEGKMRFRNIKRFFVIFLVQAFFFPVCSLASNKLTIYSTNYPLTYFAERIGGIHVNVEFPVPPDVDPAFWKPGAETVRQYQKADLIILNGAGYEKWTKKVSLPMLRSVDTSKAFKDKLISIETNVTHSHGPKGDHSHGGTAFTTWLDFSQAALQAEAIYQALVRKMPAQKDYFKKNFAELQDELLDLDRKMKKIGESLNGAAIMASHPIYQYFARRYSLDIKMMMWEPDTDPGQHEWERLQELTKIYPARQMIWEDEPLKDSSQRLKKLGIASLVFAPCMNRPDKGDFLTVMYDNIANLSIIYQ
jgi:zinc transport system substrate-binding protein